MVIRSWKYFHYKLAHLSIYSLNLETQRNMELVLI